MISIKREAQAWLIWIKLELKLSETCSKTRNNLLGALTESGLFSPEISHYFSDPLAEIPYIISDTEPTQVAELKKIINALDCAAKAISAIETINVNDDRYSAGILADIVKTSYQNIRPLYAAIQLVNQGTPETQAIIGDHFNRLFQKIALVTSEMKKYTPEHLDELTATVIADTIKHLPQEKADENEGLAHLSHFIAKIPSYFNDLLTILTPEASPRSPILTDPIQWQLNIQKRAKKMAKEFERIISQNRWAHYTGYLSTLKVLISQSSDLINTVEPFSQQAYQSAANKLNEIRHTSLPQLLTELETTEEIMGLKAGTLSEPALKNMELYYTELATQMNQLAAATIFLNETANNLDSPPVKFIRHRAGDKTEINPITRIEPIPELDVMQDATFIHIVRTNQANRLNEARTNSQDMQKIDAAHHFFDTIASYNAWYYHWDLAKLNKSDKIALLKDYQLFQADFKRLHPELDKLLVDTLNSETNRLTLTSVGRDAYKSLLATNQFKQISSCKDSCITAMKQGYAQAKLKEQFIMRTIEHRETSHYQALSQEITLLESAKTGLNEFFAHLQTQTSFFDKNINALNDVDKNTLLQAYTKFQPYLLKSSKTGFSEQLHNALTTSATDESPLTISFLMRMQTSLTTDLNAAIDESMDKINEHNLEEQTFPQELPEPTQAMASQSSLHTDTLFGRISQLNLSSKLKEFTEKKLYPYLSDNLDPMLLAKLSLDPKTRPFTESLSDPSEIVLYKKILNSVHYIQNSLNQLDAMNDYGSPDSLIYQTRFVLEPLFSLCKNITSAQYVLYNASATPALKTIINDVINIIEPLKSIPVLGQYLQPTNTEPAPSPKADILDTWKAQQIIVKQGLGLAPITGKAPELAEPPVTAPAPAESPLAKTDKKDKLEKMLKQIASHLYSLPKKINLLGLNSKDNQSLDESEIELKAQQFTTRLLQLYELYEASSSNAYSSEALEMMLITLSQINMQLSAVGVESRTVIYDNIRALHSDLGAIIVEFADDAEFNLGFKPGSLSARVYKEFNEVYETFIASLDLATNEAGLTLLHDTRLTENRLHHEIARIEKLKLVQDNETLSSVLFGTQYNNTSEIDELYRKIDSIIAEDQSLYDAQDGLNPLPELKEQIRPIYRALQQHLKARGENFDEDYLEKTSSKDDFYRALHTLTDIRHLVNHAPGIFDQLDRLNIESVESDFKDPAMQAKFLRLYADIRPYLSQIDYTHHDSYYLYVVREIQTPADFKSALENIINYKEKLNALVDGYKATEVQRITRCHERMSYLQQLGLQERVEAYQQQEAFKKSLQEIKTNETMNDTPKDKEFLLDRAMLVTLLNVEEAKTKKLPPHPLILQQINKINALIAFLDSRYSPEKPMTYHKMTLRQLDDFKENDKLVHMYNALEEILQYLHDKNKDDNPEIKTQINEITQLKRQLSNENNSCHYRIQRVQARVFSKPFEKIMLKNEDIFLVKLVKKFLSIFGYQDEKIEKLSTLKNKLENMPQESPTSATDTSTASPTKAK